MAKSQTTTAISHAGTTEFRAWLAELSGMFDTVGWTKSGDTGQINVATATRPAVNTSAGYEIRYLNDSLHATKPIYAKIEYGTLTVANYPGIWITVGSGTNGAGTITGEYFARRQVTPDATHSAGSFLSAVCGLPGYIAMSWKRGSNSTGIAFFSIFRTCDSSGAISGDGVSILYPYSGLYAYRDHYDIANATLWSETLGYSLKPGGNTGTLVSAAPQVFRHFQMQPAVRCVPFFLTFLTGEIGAHSTFTATPVGATSRTYLALDGATNSHGPIGAGLDSATAGPWTGGRLAMQWE